MTSRSYLEKIASLCIALITLTTGAYAQPEIGTTMPDFKLQATDNNFYGIQDGQNKVSILYFIGYNCSVCLQSGPDFQEKINSALASKPGLQVLVLDTWNGTPAQAESYRQITGVTAPVLRDAANGTDYDGARLDDIVVVDQDHVVRYDITASNVPDQYQAFNQFVNALLNKNPFITMSVQNLYFGTKMQVGQSKTITLDLTNTGDGPLDITGYNAPAGITVQPAQFTIPAQDKKTVSITLTPTQAGTFTGSLTLTDNSTVVGPLQVPIDDLSVEAAVVVPADPRADFDHSGTVDFPDFLDFASAFGGTDTAFDLDGSGRVDFGDFLIFAQSFGKKVG